MTLDIHISAVAYFREVLTILYYIADSQRKESCSPSFVAKVIKTLGSVLASAAFLNKVPVWSYTNNGFFSIVGTSHPS